MYHGKLKESSGTVAGERALDSFSGVCVFREKDIASVAQYSTGTHIGWEGVNFHFVWELIYKEPMTQSGGSAKNQVVVHPDNITFSKLIILPLETKDRVPNDSYVFIPPRSETTFWCPLLEANPLDLSSGLCNTAGVTEENLEAKYFLLSKKKEATGGASAAAAPAKPREINPMKMQVDPTELADLLKSLTLDNPINPVAKLVNFDQRWKDYALDMVALIRKLVDKDRGSALDAAIAGGVHPAHRSGPLTLRKGGAAGPASSLARRWRRDE